VKQQWGRNSYAGEWQNRRSIWTWTAAILALASMVGICVYRYAEVWTPLQRFYVKTYIRSGLRSQVKFSRTDSYWTVSAVGKKGSHWALDEEVTQAKTGTGETVLALTPEAVTIGDVRLVIQKVLWDNARLHDFLGQWIYPDETFLDFMRPGLLGGVGVFLVGLALAIPKDTRRARERKEGRRLKGPELVTARKFNRRNRSDGIGFELTERTLIQRVFGKMQRLVLPRAIESSHILIMGDTGMGKSALIRQILLQVEARGDTAIVYDPALEYTPKFYKPERGDIILNPIDQRMPYWSLSDEMTHITESSTLAASLFPHRHNENAFFTEGPRKIFAHLLTFRPTPEELAWWMCHEEEIDHRVKGTEYAAMINRQAPAQRSGVLASLNMIADSLKLLPREADTTKRWSAATWANERKGWLFLTSTPATRERLVPLTSLWLDTLVLRLMNYGQTGPHPVWFVLDELATLQRLPQLHTAVTENRKSNNPVVLSFQGRSQLEGRYGHETEAMLSQPATKIFLATSEPNAARWISDAIGEIETERLSESRSNGQWGQSRNSETQHLQRQRELLVIPSEITGLQPLNGYLKHRNLVVRMSFSFVDLPDRHPAFIERPMEMPRKEERKTGAAAAGVNGSPGQMFPSQDVNLSREQDLRRNRPGQGHFFR
jgi:Type IV secretion-system coupling protein DNA-binding domain